MEALDEAHGEEMLREKSLFHFKAQASRREACLDALLNIRLFVFMTLICFTSCYIKISLKKKHIRVIKTYI